MKPAEDPFTYPPSVHRPSSPSLPFVHRPSSTNIGIRIELAATARTSRVPTRTPIRLRELGGIETADTQASDA